MKVSGGMLMCYFARNVLKGTSKMASIINMVKHPSQKLAPVCRMANVQVNEYNAHHVESQKHLKATITNLKHKPCFTWDTAIDQMNFQSSGKQYMVKKLEVAQAYNNVLSLKSDKQIKITEFISAQQWYCTKARAVQLAKTQPITDENANNRVIQNIAFVHNYNYASKNAKDPSNTNEHFQQPEKRMTRLNFPPFTTKAASHRATQTDFLTEKEFMERATQTDFPDHFDLRASSNYYERKYDTKKRSSFSKETKCPSNHLPNTVLMQRKQLSENISRLLNLRKFIENITNVLFEKDNLTKTKNVYPRGDFTDIKDVNVATEMRKKFTESSNRTHEDNKKSRLCATSNKENGLIRQLSGITSIVNNNSINIKQKRLMYTYNPYRM